jgi:hypothetical protein
MLFVKTEMVLNIAHYLLFELIPPKKAGSSILSLIALCPLWQSKKSRHACPAFLTERRKVTKLKIFII